MFFSLPDVCLDTLSSAKIFVLLVTEKAIRILREQVNWNFKQKVCMQTNTTFYAHQAKILVWVQLKTIDDNNNNF